MLNIYIFIFSSFNLLVILEFRLYFVKFRIQLKFYMHVKISCWINQMQTAAANTKLTTHSERCNWRLTFFTRFAALKWNSDTGNYNFDTIM